MPDQTDVANKYIQMSVISMGAYRHKTAEEQFTFLVLVTTTMDLNYDQATEFRSKRNIQKSHEERTLL